MDALSLIYFSVWSCHNPLRTFFLGILVGHVVSYYGLRLLQNRAKAFGRLAVDGKRTSGLGTFFRLIGAGVAIWLALKYEEKIHIIGVVLGLTTSYVVMIIDYTIYSIRQSKID